MLKFLLPILALMLASSAVAGDKPNVLFIAVDDLNHWVHYLGRNAQSITPNIDKLAARGVRLIGPIGPIGPIFPATENEVLRPATTALWRHSALPCAGQ